MLSLPLITPRDHQLYTSPNRTSPFQPDPQNGVNIQQQPRNNIRRPAIHVRSPLAQLRADENKIEQRKQNVRRFGAGWLRPPGVAKTLQSKLEDEQERLEQLEMARRDAEMRAQEEAAQQAAMGGVGGLGGEAVEDQEERNLDDEVPEAEVNLDSDEEEEPTADVTFNEESLLEGSLDGEEQAVLELEDAELDGRLQDERDLGMEGDMDDDVPEAGSYEHTDTELEESSGEDEEVSFQAPPPIRAPLRSDGRDRRSLVSEDSEIVGSSSFLESSPALARRTARGNAFRNSLAAARRRPS